MLYRQARYRRRRSQIYRLIGTIVILYLLCTGGFYAFTQFGDDAPVHQEEEINRIAAYSANRQPSMTAQAAPSSYPDPAQDTSVAEEIEVSENENIDRDVWNLTLVNRENPLPADFAPAVRPVDNGNYSFDKRAADQLEQMLDDCRKTGLYPIICSAYRTVGRQDELYGQQVNKQRAKGLEETEALAVAATVVAYPGTSEHNLGLAVDIVSRNLQGLTEEQEKTPEYQWLLAHCHEYGFILRYPEEKQELTKIIYEPWHFRYVGIEAAMEIMEQEICLEEYLMQ